MEHVRYTWNNPLRHKDDDGRALNVPLALFGAGVGFVTNFAGSAISQHITTGQVDWGTATKVGAAGLAAGATAGISFGASLVAKGGASILIGTTSNVANGIGSRLASDGIDGAFDPSAVAADAKLGAAASTAGAALVVVGTGIHASIAAGVQPKLPNPNGAIQTQLRRRAILQAWERRLKPLADRLENGYSQAAAVGGSLVTNLAASVYSAYETHRNHLAVMWLRSGGQPPDAPSAGSKNSSTFRACEAGDWRLG